MKSKDKRGEKTSDTENMTESNIIAKKKGMLGYKNSGVDINNVWLVFLVGRSIFQRKEKQRKVIHLEIAACMVELQPPLQIPNELVWLFF